jgi:hypothetical protein
MEQSEPVLGIMRYRASEAITLPQAVHLQNGNLHWSGEVFEAEEIANDCCEDDENFTEYPIEGCLKDFTSLGSASEQEVLNFVQKRGVLGIAPFGVEEEDESDAENGFRVFLYAEPVWVYQLLARQCRALLTAMQSVITSTFNDAGALSVDAEAFQECFPLYRRGRQSLALDRMTPRQVYLALVEQGRSWSAIASYKFLLDGDPAQGQTPHFVLDFGKWGQASDWDWHTLETWGDGIRELPHHLATLPSRCQRPSPLFNVLAFQLAQALTLPEGVCWCDYCDGLYFYDREEAKDPKSSNFGMTKPRTGSTVSFCCGEHQIAKANQRKYRNRVGNGYFERRKDKVKENVLASL